VDSHHDRALADGLGVVMSAQFSLFPPELPARVKTLPFWEPFGGAAVDGIKNPETRTRPWGDEPCYLAVYASHTVDRKAADLLGERAAGYVSRTSRGRLIAIHGGHLIGLLLITGSRPMTQADVAGALIEWSADRHAWNIGRAWRFRTPIPTQGRQVLWYTPRAVILGALGGSL